MPTFILRNVDPDLWAKFKTRAASEGRTLRWIVLTLVRHYVSHGLPAARLRPASPQRLRFVHPGEMPPDQEPEA